MKPNVGPNERYLRIGIGVIAAIAAVKFSKSRTVSALLGAVAASGIETGLSRYCPMSAFLGIDNAPELFESPIKSVLKSKTIRRLTGRTSDVLLH